MKNKEVYETIIARLLIQLTAREHKPEIYFFRDLSANIFKERKTINFKLQRWRVHSFEGYLVSVLNEH